MFTIESDYQLINYHTGMTATMRALNVGDSFVCPIRLRSSAYQCAIQAGIKIITTKQGGSVRIIRVN